jgi:hypothetical protein
MVETNYGNGLVRFRDPNRIAKIMKEGADKLQHEIMLDRKIQKALKNYEFVIDPKLDYGELKQKRKRSGGFVEFRNSDTGNKNDGQSSLQEFHRLIKSKKIKL